MEELSKKTLQNLEIWLKALNIKSVTNIRKMIY